MKYVGVISKRRDIFTTNELLHGLNQTKGVRGIFLPTSYLRPEILDNGILDLKLMQHSVNFIDVFIPRIGRTYTSLGVMILRHIENMGIPTTLSSSALQISRNKFATYQMLARHGLPVPKTLLITNPYHIDQQLKDVRHPAVIKLLDSHGGLGVIRSHSLQTTKEIIETLFVQNATSMILVQEFLKPISQNEKNRISEDIRLFVIDDQVIAAMKRRATTKHEWRTNFSRGGSTMTHQPTSEETEIALKAVALLKLEIAGVDMIITRKGPYLIELNACPGWKGIQSVTKKKISDEIIRYALQKAKR